MDDRFHSCSFTPVQLGLSPCMFSVEPWGHRLPRRTSLRLHHLPAWNGASSTWYHLSRDPPSLALHGPWGAPSTRGTLASPPSVGALAPHQPCSGCSHHGYPSAGRLSRGFRYQWRSRPARRSAVASTQKPISPCPGLSDVSACCSTFACFTLSLIRPFRLLRLVFSHFLDHGRCIIVIRGPLP